jgi:hypothetical protein
VSGVRNGLAIRPNMQGKQPAKKTNPATNQPEKSTHPRACK